MVLLSIHNIISLRISRPIGFVHLYISLPALQDNFNLSLCIGHKLADARACSRISIIRSITELTDSVHVLCSAAHCLRTVSSHLWVLLPLIIGMH